MEQSRGRTVRKLSENGGGGGGATGGEASYASVVCISCWRAQRATAWAAASVASSTTANLTQRGPGGSVRCYCKRLLHPVRERRTTYCEISPRREICSSLKPFSAAQSVPAAKSSLTVGETVILLALPHRLY